jgi:hypothetical protein
VRTVRVELTQRGLYSDLNAARLPIPPRPQFMNSVKGWCGRGDSNSQAKALVPKTSASTNSATPAWPFFSRKTYKATSRGLPRGMLTDNRGRLLSAFADKWSEWRDSNSRPSGPKPDALPDCATLRNGECPFFVYPMLTRFVEACNRAYEKRGGRGDLNSRRTGSQPVALPLSYAHHPFFQQTGHVPGGELAEGYLRFQRTVPVGTAAVTAASVS